MIKTVIFASVIILSMIGLGDVLHRLWMLFYKTKGKKIILLPLENNTAAMQIKEAAAQLRWYGRDFADTIVCISDCLDDAENEECRLLCGNSDVLKLYAFNEAKDFINAR